MYATVFQNNVSGATVVHTPDNAGKMLNVKSIRQ